MRLAFHLHRKSLAIEQQSCQQILNFKKGTKLRKKTSFSRGKKKHLAGYDNTGTFRKRERNEIEIVRFLKTETITKKTDA